MTKQNTKSNTKPTPLYPTHQELTEFDLTLYPDLEQFLVHETSDQAWRKAHWLWGFAFLTFIGRNKSEHTYTRFRNEVERFLLWTFLFHKKPVDTFKKQDILDYADHCWKPPEKWIGTANKDKFVYVGNVYKSNKEWAPFRLQNAKSATSQVVDKKKYKPSQQTLTSMFTGVSAFYNYLIGEEITYANPAQLAKKDCKYFIKDAQVKEVRRLTHDQWSYVFDVALELANKDPAFERSLFVISALKTLFLRISELSERANWSPMMSHFWEDSEHNWWLKIYGKGRKIRDITVPDSFLPFLKRYRLARDLDALPHPSDTAPIVEKLRGQGSMSARHLTRIVQQVFDHAYTRMKAKEGEDKARKLKEASTHWLRHTGASMEIERGRALKDLSEDLGHASMATTDTIYVQTENKNRAKSGKYRKVTD